MAFDTLFSMKKKILIADDDPGIRDIFKMIFEKAGYSVDMKDNGRDLLEDNYERPDIFLIDKQLSGVDGLNICRHLKSRKSTKNIPVIMISASPDLGPMAQKAGADDYIEKPFDLKCLLALVDKHVSLSKQMA